MSEPFVTPFDRFDPDAVARSERFIDAVAKGEPVEFSDVADEGDTGDRALAGLLEDWRDELRVPVPERSLPGAGRRRGAWVAGWQRVVAPAGEWRW